MQQSELDLTFIAPTVTADGNAVFIRDVDNVPIINFFQIRKQVGDQVLGDVVASVRFDSIDELRKFGKSIEETIKNHQAREK